MQTLAHNDAVRTFLSKLRDESAGSRKKFYLVTFSRILSQTLEAADRDLRNAASLTREQIGNLVRLAFNDPVPPAGGDCRPRLYALARQFRELRASRGSSQPRLCSSRLCSSRVFVPRRVAELLLSFLVLMLQTTLSEAHLSPIALPAFAMFFLSRGRSCMLTGDVMHTFLFLVLRKVSFEGLRFGGGDDPESGP